MRHSKSNAYRATDLTIVVVGLACAIVAAAAGIFLGVSTSERDGATTVADGEPAALEQPLPTAR